MRTKEEFNIVVDLKKKGYNKSQISKITKIPRSTISDWLNNDVLFEKKEKYNINEHLKSKESRELYSYVLGLYLGDGHINKMKRTWRLRIFMDSKYDNLNSFVHEKLSIFFNENKVNIIKSKKSNLVIFTVHSNELCKLFPQHGEGLKHKRKINLFNWQEKITVPEFLLKGLFHSDGCYCYHKGEKVKHYIYSFKNESKDIHEIFQKCCGKLKIDFTFNKNTTGIYKKYEVEKLYKLIGSKEDVK